MRPLSQANTSVIIHLLLIAVIAGCLYLPALSAPFVLDDAPVILDNSGLLSPAAYLPFSGTPNHPRSFGYLTFSLTYLLGGPNPAGHRLFNIIIHAASAMLLYALLRILTSLTGSNAPGAQSGGPAALAAALVFTAHPVQTQAVTYIAQRFASLATLLYLLAVVAYVLSRRPADSRSRIRWYSLSLVSALLAMKTKEIAFTLPLMVALAEVLFFRAKGQSRLPWLLPFFLLLIIMAASLGPVAGTAVSGPDILPAETLSITRHDYLITQVRVIATYLRLLALPVNQNLDYDYPVLHEFLDADVLASLAPSLLFLGLGVYAIYRSYKKEYEEASRFRLAGFGIVWFFLSLSVESSFIPIRDVIFEHRLYLPSVGIVIALAALLWPAGRRAPYRRLVMTAACVAIVLLSIAALTRNLQWRSAEGLWADTVQKSPAKARPHNNLGLAYAEAGQMEKAGEEFRTAVTLDPDFAEAQVNLGNILYTEGRLDEALTAYERAVELAPRFAKARYNIGNLYLKMGRRGDAIAAYEKALELKPDYRRAEDALRELTGKQPEQ